MTQWILSSSALICGVMLLRRLMRGRVNPRVQYALWAIVLIRLILPMSFSSSGLSVQNVGQQVLKRPEVRQMYDTMNEPILSDRDLTQRPQLPEAGQESSASLPQQQIQESGGQLSDAAPTVPSESPALSFRELLLRIWLGGMSVLAAWMIGCNAHFAAGLCRSRRLMELPASPLEVYITEVVETPCLFGMFRPAVYLTPEAVEDDRVRRYVLTHELTHYRQFDHVWAVLRAVCLVLHWYNPLVWLAFRASRQDGEMACDEGTLKQLGEEHRADYGRTLVALATRTRLRATMVTATTMADGKKAIRERIVILMKNPKTALVTMICLLLCCALIVGCTFTGAVEDPEETKPTETTPISDTAPTETEITDSHAEYYELLTSDGAQTNWLHEAMNYAFDDPRELDLFYFFYNGFAGTGDGFTENETDYLEMNGFSTALDVQKLNAEEMNRVLRETFGLAITEFRKGIPESWVYYQPTNCYYTNHNDTVGMGRFTITGVIEDGDVVSIYYLPAEGAAIASSDGFLAHQEMLLTLYRTEEYGYQVMGNQPADRQGTQEGTESADPYAGYYELLRFSEMRNWLNIALGCEFDAPEDVDLEVFFYPGTDSLRYWERLANHEAKFLMEQGLGGGHFAIMPVSRVEEIVQSTFGLSLEEFACGIPESWHYFQENDSYYVRYETSGGELYRYTIESIIIDRVEVLENDLIQVYYTPNDTSSYLNGQPMVLTLRGNENDGYMAVSNQMVVSEGQPYTTLTLEQIEQVNEAFEWSYVIKDNWVGNSAISCFFDQYYESPDQIDLVQYLRYFSGYGVVEDFSERTELTEEEFWVLKERKANDFPFYGLTDYEDAMWRGAPIHKIPRDVVDTVLKHFTGMPLDTLLAAGEWDVLYLEEYDSFYTFTSDMGGGVFRCVGGRIYDGYVELYSENAVLTLRRTETGDYCIYSHLPIE